MKPTPIARRPRIARTILFCTSAILAVSVLAARGQSPGVSKLAGSWTWTWTDNAGKTHKHTLEVEGVDKALAAREVFDDLPPVKVAGLTYRGDAVGFNVSRGEHQAEYRGKMADQDTINGTVTVTTAGQPTEFPWKAVRMKPLAPEQPAPKKEP